MIELVEAQVIAQQMSDKLQGKRVASCVRGNVAHKSKRSSIWAAPVTFVPVARWNRKQIGAFFCQFIDVVKLALGR
jgi:hypothetical protein